MGKKLAFASRIAEYNPRKVNATVCRFREPRATAMVYSGGRVMISGAKSEAQAKDVGKKVAVLCQKTGHTVKFSKFKIENIIVTQTPNSRSGWSSSTRITSSRQPTSRSSSLVLSTGCWSL